VFSGGSRAAAAIVAAALFIASGAARALDRDAVEKLAFGEGDERIAAIAALVAEGDAKAVDLLKAFAAGDVQTSGKRSSSYEVRRRSIPLRARKARCPPSATTWWRTTACAPRSRCARRPEPAVAGKSARLAAAKALAGVTDAVMYPLIEKALAKETDAEIRALLEMTAAGMQLNADSPDARRAAIRLLGHSSNPNSKTLLLGLASDADPDIRREARMSLEAVEKRLAWGEWLGLAFAGVSLGSILLLAALGLAITYGLMGVINMAHGELIMIGAYSAYVVQNVFRAWGIFDWYLVGAIRRRSSFPAWLAWRSSAR